MSGWIERQLQKLRTKEQEYRAWLRENLGEDATNLSDFGKTEKDSIAQADVEVLSQELGDSVEDDEGSGESTSEPTSEKTNQDDGSSSPAARAAHRRVLIQRAEDLLRRISTLDEAPAPEQRRRAERLAKRLRAYLHEAPDPSPPEQDGQFDEEDSAEKRGRGPVGSEGKDPSSGPDQEEETKEAVEPEGSGSGSATDTGVKQALCEAFIEWCHEGGAMVDRYYMFERRVREEHGDVEVTPIYQDTRASGVELTYDADDISDEFWLVEVGTRHLVFPQPRDATHFRTLDPLFDSVGDPSPETLSDIRPAVVRLDGDSYLLESSGLVG